MRRLVRASFAAAAATATAASESFAEQLRRFDVSGDGSRLRRVGALIALLNAAGTTTELEEAMTQMAQLARNRAHFYGIQRIDLGQEAAEALLRACYRVGAHEHALEALRMAPRTIGIHTIPAVYEKAMNLSGLHGVDNVMQLFDAMKKQGLLPGESVLKTLVFNLIKLKRRVEALHVVKEFQHNSITTPEPLVAKILVSIVESNDVSALNYMKTLAGISSEGIRSMLEAELPSRSEKKQQRLQTGLQQLLP